MRDHEILGHVERELVSTAFLLEAEKQARSHRPYVPPPKRKPRQRSPEQLARIREQARAARKRQRAKWAAMGIA
jgi:hypothetical protein